jgi:nucleoside-diphosphate-sugar epimerase
MKKTILITGINGFLGSNLALQFKDSYNIVGLEISTQNLTRLQGENFPIYEANPAGLEKLFAEQKITGIIHTATLYGRETTLKSVLFENNVLNPIVLLEKAIENGLEYFINTDSFFNDGNLNYSYLSDYTLTKKQLIEWLKAFTNQVKIVNMKIFHMYGPGDAPNKFIPWLIEQLKSNVSEINLTPGEQTRDFIYIADVCTAFKTVCDKMDEIPDSFASFDVGTGNSISLREFIETAKQVLNSNSNLNVGLLPYRDGEIMKSEAEKGKLAKLGWEAIFPVNVGISKCVKSN